MHTFFLGFKLIFKGRYIKIDANQPKFRLFYPYTAINNRLKNTNKPSISATSPPNSSKIYYKIEVALFIYPTR